MPECADREAFQTTAELLSVLTWAIFRPVVDEDRGGFLAKVVPSSGADFQPDRVILSRDDCDHVLEVIQCDFKI